MSSFHVRLLGWHVPAGRTYLYITYTDIRQSIYDETLAGIYVTIRGSGGDSLDNKIF